MKRILLFLVSICGITMAEAQNSVTIDVVTPPCNNDGVATAHWPALTPPPYTVGWYVANGWVYHTTMDTTDMITNLPAGLLGCQVNPNTAFTQYSNSLNVAPFTFSVSTTPAVCPTPGQGIVTITSGTGPFQYFWTQAITGDTLGIGNPATLPPTTYHLTIVDAAGCTQTADSMGNGSPYPTGPIEVGYTPVFTLSTGFTPASCTNGTATVNIISGTNAPYTYAWQNGATTPTITNLVTGNYGCTVTDASGCTMSENVHVPQNPIIAVNFSSTPATCLNNNGSSIAFAGGGATPYTFLWSNGSTSNTITGVAPGNYYVGVTDANNCTGSGSIYISTSSPIVSTVTTTTSLCSAATGSATLAVSGGQPPYTINWSTFPIQTGLSATGLIAGNYSFYITDANGCVRTGNAQITNPQPVVWQTSTTPSACASSTGTASLMMIGGTPPFTTSWNTSPPQTGLTANSLPVGATYFTVTEGNGCQKTDSIVIAPIVDLQITMNTTAPQCLAANGSIATIVTGGTSYTYLWNNGTTGSSIANLAQGAYYLTVTDAPSGCSKSKIAYLASSSPVTMTVADTPASCIFTNDGVLYADATGGTAPYTYTFDGFAAIGNSASGLAPQSYHWVSVVDAAGCIATASGPVGVNLANTSCYCTLTGKVFYDQNGNCTIEAGENGIQNVQMHVAGYGYQYTNSMGDYSFKVPTGNYFLNQTIQNIYPLASCQSNIIPIIATSATGCVITNNIADTLNPLHDVKINLWSVNTPVPGFLYHQTLVISNQGTVTEQDIVVGYQSDGQLNAATFTSSVPFINSGLNYWQASGGTLSLSPGNNYTSTINYNVPANIPNSTSLVFKDSTAYTSPMSNWINDYTPYNNVNYVVKIVQSSYDPNFKEVFPTGSGPEGNIFQTDSVLDYAVHFQNLGTFMAQNIYVLDTLDADLDWTTLKPIYLSHPGTITISEGGILKADFPGINLPPKSQSEALSTGMFTYSIRRKANLPLGTEFTNSAAIYFDYNAPVITNTTLNTLFDTMGVDNIKNIKQTAGLRIFPNPAGNAFSIVTDLANAEAARITVANTQGQVVFSQEANISSGAQQTNVNTSNLASGVYFVTLEHARGRETAKVVILK